MRSLLRRLAAVALLASAATATAGAQTSITRDFSFQSGAAVPVGYLTFGVTTPGTFAVSTSMNSDPMVWLFAGTPGMLGTTLDVNDDSHGTLDSFLSRHLDVGTYTVAVGHYYLYEDEARAGVMNSSAMNGTLAITSGTGVAFDTATVPEPGTYAMLATGLAGVVAVARRRRQA